MRRHFSIAICASLFAIVLLCELRTAHAQNLGVVLIDQLDYSEVDSNPDAWNGSNFGELGWSLTRFEDILVASAVTGYDHDGAAYAFRVETDGNLTYLSQLDWQVSSPFRYGTMVSGDQGWVAVIRLDTAVLLYERVGDDFVFRQELTPPTLGAIEMANFDAVDMSGNTLMVGDPQAYINATDRAGAVAVYQRSGGTWTLQTILPHPLVGVDNDNEFGTAIAMDDDLAIISDTEVEVGGQTAGAAYLYQRDGGGTWQLIKNLGPKPDDYVTNGARWGYSVAVSQDTVAVGCSTCNNATSGGSVYIHDRDQGGADNWGLAQEITGVVGEYFGLREEPQALYLRGAVLAFGTTDDELVVYTRAIGMPFLRWAYVDESGTGAQQMAFGHSIDGVGRSIFVGAPNWPNEPGPGGRRGALYDYRIVAACHGPDTIYCDDFEGFQQQP